MLVQIAYIKKTQTHNCSIFKTWNILALILIDLRGPWSREGLECCTLKCNCLSLPDQSVITWSISGAQRSNNRPLFEHWLELETEDEKCEWLKLTPWSPLLKANINPPSESPATQLLILIFKMTFPTLCIRKLRCREVESRLDLHYYGDFKDEKTQSYWVWLNTCLFPNCSM